MEHAINYIKKRGGGRPIIYATGVRKLRSPMYTVKLQFVTVMNSKITVWYGVM